MADKQLTLTNLVFFNGAITVQNIHTGEHRTFKLVTQPEDSEFAPGQRVLSLLTGPNNEADYESFAFVDDEKGIAVWKRFRGQGGQKSAHEWYADMISGLSGHHKTTCDWSQPSAKAPEGYKLLVERHCLRCNRLLTTPDSIAMGMGPTCREKLGG